MNFAQQLKTHFDGTAVIYWWLHIFISGFLEDKNKEGQSGKEDDALASNPFSHCFWRPWTNLRRMYMEIFVKIFFSRPHLNNRSFPIIYEINLLLMKFYNFFLKCLFEIIRKFYKWTPKTVKNINKNWDCFNIFQKYWNLWSKNKADKYFYRHETNLG